MRWVLKVEPTDRARLSGERLIDLADLATSDYFVKFAQTKAPGQPAPLIAVSRRFHNVDTLNVGFADVQRDRIRGASGLLDS